MRLGAGTLRQEIGNQSSTFFLNEHGPTEDHSLIAPPVNVLWLVLLGKCFQPFLCDLFLPFHE